MKHLFLMDPVQSVDIEKDSTFALMWEAQRRGYEVLYAHPGGLSQYGDGVHCEVQNAILKKTQGDHAQLGPSRSIHLGDTDVVWMRKDPPFDMDYIFSTYLLDKANEDTLVVNHPDGLRSVNEKAWIMGFDQLIPESVITQEEARLRDFVNQFGAIVVKPLDGNGGAGVFIVRDDDPNIGVILEMSTRNNTRKVMAQRYLPEAKTGDKRIILVDGEAVGAIMRVPRGVDHRGNIHVGARVEPARLTAREEEICAAIGPTLKARGQVFVGIDVIGDWLSEVNVTSPTGIHEINAFDGVCLEALILDAAEARLNKAQP